MLLGLAAAHAAPPAPEQVAATLPGPVLAGQDHSRGGLEVTLTAPGLSDESAADLPPDWPDEAIVATSHDDSTVYFGGVVDPSVASVEIGFAKDPAVRVATVAGEAYRPSRATRAVLRR